ncbi:protein phosphatase 2C [Bacillus anthracis]|uniref:protein phosphatase 2C n=1 Tax=Bacillus anthracis TaxID=1392 RepID=UPI00253FFD3A|nr:protein phosphatase 2C [Bacillus anthracis]WIG23697.1 protein phosphatase 2C [Bacillus anthracis]
MLKKLKRFMVVAAAAVMLSAGFATVAPKEASAHWADNNMNWAMNNGYIKSDNRDSYLTRQETWLVLGRYHQKRPQWPNSKPLNTYEQGRQYAMHERFSDGSRGTDYITRDEVAVMLVRFLYLNLDYKRAVQAAKNWGLYDGSRGSSYATKAEIVTMMHNFAA